MDVHAHACKMPEAVLDPFEYQTPGELGPHEVDLEISDCGICHSDVHLIDNDWGINRYPVVPRHEIVGSVRALGALVDGLKLGQRVGVGWQRGSCGRCAHCRAGDENVCTKMDATCVGHFGGFADRIRIDTIAPRPTSSTGRPAACRGPRRSRGRA